MLTPVCLPVYCGRCRVQTLFQEQLQSEGSPRTLLVVAVHDYEPSSSEEADEMNRERIFADLQAVWDSVPKVSESATTC